MTTEIMDQLYLEISQFTTARTRKDIAGQKAIEEIVALCEKGTGELTDEICLSYLRQIRGVAVSAYLDIGGKGVPVQPTIPG